MKKIHSADLTAQIFGRWTVTKKVGKKYGITTWWCRCQCGNEKEVSSGSLIHGGSQSCGCLQKERTRKANTIHGRTKNGEKFPEYHVWYDMILRCEKPSMPNYHRYGLRGISVCEKWRHSFDDFLKDMGFRPSSRHRLDRINNDGNYEPSNCRWATLDEQSNNKSNCIYLTHNGDTLTIAQWARRTKISESTISRKVKRGLTIEEIISAKKRA